MKGTEYALTYFTDTNQLSKGYHEAEQCVRESATEATRFDSLKLYANALPMYVKAVGFLDIAIALCESPRKRAECEKARESYVQRGKQVRMLLVNPPAGRMTVHRAASLLEINPTSPEASDARVFLLAEGRALESKADEISADAAHRLRRGEVDTMKDAHKQAEELMSDAAKLKRVATQRVRHPSKAERPSHYTPPRPPKDQRTEVLGGNARHRAPLPTPTTDNEPFFLPSRATAGPNRLYDDRGIVDPRTQLLSTPPEMVSVSAGVSEVVFDDRDNEAFAPPTMPRLFDEHDEEDDELSEPSDVDTVYVDRSHESFPRPGPLYVTREEAAARSKMCVICKAAPKTTLLQHGDDAHVCCCMSCASRAKTCPVCDKPVAAIIQVRS